MKSGSSFFNNPLLVRSAFYFLFSNIMYTLHYFTEGDQLREAIACKFNKLTQLLDTTLTVPLALFSMSKTPC